MPHKSAQRPNRDDVGFWTCLAAAQLAVAFLAVTRRAWR